MLRIDCQKDEGGKRETNRKLRDDVDLDQSGSGENGKKWFNFKYFLNLLMDYRYERRSQ